MDLERLIAQAPAFASRFEYRALLGQGAMGAVFRARDAQRDCDVAIKVALHEEGGREQGDAGLRKLWLNEMRLAGKLRHPHVVELYEAGDAGAFSYLVMECVDGGSLRQHVMPTSLLPVDKAIDAVFKVARALEYANMQGLLHRDVKPANVLLDSAGQPKVSDFGSSFATESEVTQVLAVGTLPFVPPEQLAGGPPDIQSDIYATGVMAYQLLSGALPYDATSQGSLVYQKMNMDPVALAARRADLPPQLAAAIDRSIHRDRAQRYPAWAPFCDELSRLMPSLNARLEVIPESERYEQLKSLRFFAPFGEAELWEAARICGARRVHAGDTIFREGSPGASVHVLCSGLLEVARKGVKLGRIEAGDCFGELAFVEAPHHIRSATVTALEDATFVEFEAEAVGHASARLQAALSRAIMGVLVARLHRADARYLDRVLRR